MKALKKFFLISILSLLCLISIFLGYYFIVTKDITLDDKKLLLSDQYFLIYDKDLHPIKNTALSSPQQTVRLDDINEQTKQAFICVEDKRFYSHSGFDVKRIAKAVINNLKARSFKEGASTISQQLIKNTHLTQEKTMKRKLQEWKLTKQLEQKYSKDEILEKYLNSIYFGHNCFGLQAAAEFYFEKEPKELNLADSAILAGLVKSPNNYSPFKNPENCIKRKAVVLSLMQSNEKITQQEKKNALNTPLPIQNPRNGQNRGYLNSVFDELSDIVEEKNIVLGGKIEIFTALDVNLQNEIEKISQENTSCDKTLFAIDGTSGNFKAFISTVGNIKRLPGSLIKPLLVYAPAIEENVISPATPILDARVNYAGYTPENYDKSYHGYISAREALAKSLNIPAVKILQSLNIQKGISYLNKMHLKTEPDDASLALALGGMKNGFTFRSIATAYTALQNKGVMKNGGFITEIKINERNVYKQMQTSTRIFTEETAYLTTDMLKSATQYGTAKKLRDLPFDIAAKTGTVGNENGNTDAYAVSYTTKDLIGVWLGNADNTAIEHTGGGLPCNFLLQLNQHLYEQYTQNKITIEPFQKTDKIESVFLDKTSYYDTHTILLADDYSPLEYRFSEIFKKDTIPKKKCDSFSNPSISAPLLKVKDGLVSIQFEKHCPAYYTYRVERYDYVTHTTIYNGGFKEMITDEIEPNKRYVYTVTPLFKDRQGVPIVLPEINSKIEKKEEILNKDWWNY